MNTDTLRFYASWFGTIMPITAVSSAAMALVLFWLHREVLRKQNWPLLIASAYAVFTLQYVLRGILVLIKGWPQAEAFHDWVHFLLSTANNLLLFLAAAALLGLCARYRQIIFAAAAIATVFHAFDFGIWNGFPDAILSVVCLTTLGFGLATSLKLGSAGWLSRLAIFMGVGYSLVNVLYALTPIFAESRLLLAGQELDQELIELRSKACIALILIGALAFKFILFVLALTPIIRSIGILKPSIFKNTLDAIRDGDKEFFNSKGVVRAIGKSYGADVAEICMRIPKMTRQQVLYWHWHNADTIKGYTPIAIHDDMAHGEDSDVKAEIPTRLSVTKSNIFAMPTPSDSIVGQMLDSGKTCKSKDTSNSPLFAQDMVQASEYGIRSLVAAPIRYHGATIGGLILKWKTRQTYSDVLVDQLKFLADFLAPGLQSERQLSTLDQSTFKLPQLELTQPGGPYSLSKRIAIVQNAMSPLATLIKLDIGFRTKWSACNAHSCYRDHTLTAEEERNKKFASGKTHELTERSGYEETMVRKTPLVVKDFKLGTLMMAYPKGNQQKNFAASAPPMLGANYIHRRTIATLVADAILDSARIELSAILSETQNTLNASSTTSVETWYLVLNRAAKKAEIIWLVVKGPDGTFFGHHGCVNLVQRVMPLDRQRSEEIGIFSEPLDRPFAGAQHLVSVNLPITSARLWFGIMRKAFRAELDFLSPWRDFLERFAAAADAALTRLTAARDLDRFALEAARQQGLNTALITTGTMTHQLVNFANGFGNAIVSLNESIARSDLREDVDTANLLKSLKSSTLTLRRLVEPLSTATALDDRQPCKIGEAIEATRKLHEARLEQQHIKLVSNIGSRSLIEVDIPYYVLTLALANLVTNGIDAAGDYGSIRITVTEAANLIYCSVRDDGPGIAPGIAAEDIFKLGVTSKKGSGGWGLYLTERSLIEAQASVKLAETGIHGTEFVLQLPKPR